MHWQNCERRWPRSRAMNEPFDPLEAELAALQPYAPSPELKQRIANQLATHPVARQPGRKTYFMWTGAIAGGLIAASIVVVVLLRDVPDGNPGLKLPLASPQLLL